MTFLTAAQSTAIRLNLGRPASFFGSTNRFEQEICDLASEVAEDIMCATDWRALTAFWEITGDGTSLGFDLPVDFDRMLEKGAVFRPDWSRWQYLPAKDLDEWRMLLNGFPTVSPGYWIILNGQLQITPVLGTGVGAQLYYISKNVVAAADTTPKPNFTADTDTMRLDERLLTLGLIWRWKSMKGMEYAEDIANYESMLEDQTAKERGSRIAILGGRTYYAGIGTAYPWPLHGP